MVPLLLASFLTLSHTLLAAAPDCGFKADYYWDPVPCVESPDRICSYALVTVEYPADNTYGVVWLDKNGDPVPLSYPAGKKQPQIFGASLTQEAFPARQICTLSVKGGTDTAEVGTWNQTECGTASAVASTVGSGLGAGKAKKGSNTPALSYVCVNCLPADETPILTDLELGGKTGDNFIGPTCNNDNSYRTCFYLTGESLPPDSSNYLVSIDGVSYPVAFFQVVGPDQVVLCVTDVAAGTGGADVTVELVGIPCSISRADLFEAPFCSCAVTGLRLGGQQGDLYVGPTCNADGTYRTTLYLTGQKLPGNVSAYEVSLDGVAYTPVFFQVLSESQVVIGLTGLPSGSVGVDVVVQAGTDCGIVVEDLFDAPTCSCPDCSCSITNLRLGGEPGDNYVGPNCNQDTTYRTTLYLTGTQLPGDAAGYQVKIDGVSYPVVFFQSLAPDQVVLGLTGLPSGAVGVDVTVETANGCALTIPDLYDAPSCFCEITGFRIGGEAGDSYIGPSCNADGTYRTTFYITGQKLPESAAGYTVVIDGQPYSPVFFQLLSPSQVVIGLTGLPAADLPVDVTVVLSTGCDFTVPEMYTPPVCPAAAQGFPANVPWMAPPALGELFGRP